MVSLHSLEDNRASWKVIGSDLFLETLSVKRRWIRGEAWRQRERLIQEGEEGVWTRACTGKVERRGRTDGSKGVKGPDLTGCREEKGGVPALGSTIGRD